MSPLTQLHKVVCVIEALHLSCRHICTAKDQRLKTDCYRNTIQYNTIQCNAMQCNAMQCNTIQCNAMQYNAMQCNTIQYNTMQYNTIQYNTIQYNATLSSLYREICLLARHLHKTSNTLYNKTSIYNCNTAPNNTWPKCGSPT